MVFIFVVATCTQVKVGKVASFVGKIRKPRIFCPTKITRYTVLIFSKSLRGFNIQVLNNVLIALFFYYRYLTGVGTPLSGKYLLGGGEDMGLFAKNEHTDKEPHYTTPLAMPLHQYCVPSSVPMDTVFPCQRMLSIP